MAQLEAAGMSGSHRNVSHLVPTRPSLSLENHEVVQRVASQGKEAMIHDFLSICGTGRTSSSSVAVTNNGLQQSVTQDLLQPLQKDLNPGGTNFLPHAFVLGGATSHMSMSGGAGQESSFAFVGNGSFQLPASFPSKHRSSTISFGAKLDIPQAIPLKKVWQQQQEVLDGNKRPARVPSEDDDDEESSFDHNFIARKESRYQKSETIMQHGEERNMDSKGASPRSKHSATEQRRRSKINDRFQMLRQLLPNADQKRDKASFLLEVIEYIQMLHEKVKKYEAAEIKGPLQERTKKISLHQDLPSHEAREVVDLSGCVKTQSSPLRVMSEECVTSSELRGNVVQMLAFQGPSSYKSKPLISKPIPITLSHHPSTSIVNHTYDPIHQLTIPQQLMADRRTLFGQFFCAEDPAAPKASCALPNQDLQVSGSCEKSKDVEGQVKVSQVAADIDSTSKGGGNRGTRDTSGNDGSDLEQRSDVAANEQEAPAILGGVINISSVYSQGVLDTLMRALQSSGVDLAQASISVQIDLGKPGGSVLPTSKQMASSCARTLPCPPKKETASAQESERPTKRPKSEVV